MSKLDVTTQDLFLRIASTSHARSTKADAVFRRLRLDEQDQIAEALMRAPRRLEKAALGDEPKNPVKSKKRPISRAGKPA